MAPFYTLCPAVFVSSILIAFYIRPKADYFYKMVIGLSGGLTGIIISAMFMGIDDINALLLIIIGIGGGFASTALLAFTIDPRKPSRPKTAPKKAVPASSTSDNPNQEKPPTIRLFLSYRRADSAEITGRIYDRLVSHFGRENVFKDVDSIPLGVDFRQYLNEQVSRCNTLVTVIGPTWISAAYENGVRRLDDPGDFVRIEIASALQRNISVIPILVRNAEMPKEHELPPDLKALAFRNASMARNDPDFHNDLDRVIKSMERSLSENKVL
jgi:hypothetical protein